ncbi:MAG: acetaldehyde dehydrogenase (acetylating) [Selenomonas sp.]|uniref:acetaldehyde dehydrogenase (acetylating) n=1 Tax=Selenomonas sp. TaxID=2053611 RepID=UPI0025EDB398|nr:acetaldehyde dehydrogenase (acetylating) [Selenomonas sp.]MCR5756865.1 acetaldehyde dehydrogenase (acetylating) [Selenomonas sp.]
MQKKIKVAIIGTGNIGSDLLMKIKRSPWLECNLFAGRSLTSKGIQRAKEMGIPVSDKSIHAIENDPSCCDIVFDATSADAHKEHAPILRDLHKFTVDLTPALVGPMCVPVLNLNECMQADNVNMITCGGQATVPLASAINSVHPDATKYIEIVASISSKSAGPGTRANIDEFTQTTGDALAKFTQTDKTKAIIILNSAEPPVHMRNTVYALIDNPDMPAIIKAVRDMEKKIQKYVPGYRLLYDPVLENGRVTTAVEVVGQGDYLPKYAGNLDIITCAAMEVAEHYAQKLLKERGELA